MLAEYVDGIDHSGRYRMSEEKNVGEKDRTIVGRTILINMLVR